MNTIEHRVRERAYYIWEGEGRVFGRAEAHWLQAQAELTVEVVAEAPAAEAGLVATAPKAPARAKNAAKTAPKAATEVVAKTVSPAKAPVKAKALAKAKAPAKAKKPAGPTQGIALH